MIGADILLKTLEENGVDLIFGYPGGAVIPLYDRLSQFPNIKHILVRNEQGAGFCAQGVARSTKKLGVALCTSGPGVTNLITGVMDAYMDSIPTLFITGQVSSKIIGNDAFQELDTIGATMSFTKHSFFVEDVNQIPTIVEEAIKIATTGRPGPVVIDFPKDVSLAEFVEKKDLKFPLYHKDINLKIEEKQIKEAIKLINESKKPILLVGQGVKLSDSEVELNNFVNKLEIPTVTTLLAKGTIREDNSNYLGMLGMHGFYHANMAVNNADLIINIGSRFDDRIVGTYDSFGKNAKIIHIDVDKAELNKLVKNDLSIHSDAKTFLKSILKQDLQNLEIQDWKNEINDFNIIHPFEKETSFFSMKNALNIINNETSKNIDNFIFATDVGQHQMWSAQILKVASTKNWMSSGGSGTMGFALPTAIGTSFVNPNKNIVCIVGDGGIQMNIQELQLLFEYNLNVKVIIMNNNYLGMVRQWQDLFFDKNYAYTNISSPDFQKLAEAYRIKGYLVQNEEELEKVIIEEFNNHGPCIIEVKFSVLEENIFPMVPTGKTLGETIVL